MSSSQPCYHEKPHNDIAGRRSASDVIAMCPAEFEGTRPEGWDADAVIHSVAIRPAEDVVAPSGELACEAAQARSVAGAAVCRRMAP